MLINEHCDWLWLCDHIDSACRPTERGGSRGKCPGARGPPQKNLSLCENRWKRGRNGEVKNCSSDMPLVWSLNFFEGPFEPPSGPRLGPPGPGSSCPVGSKTCHVLLDDCQKSHRPDQNPSTAKKQDYFKGVFFRIISLYCIVFLDFS